MERQQISLTVPVVLLSQIDETAAALGISRTAYMIQAVARAVAADRGTK